MRGWRPDAARLTDDEIVAMARTLSVGPALDDDEIVAVVRKLESHVRSIAQEEIALSAPSCDCGDVSNQLSKLTGEVERGMQSLTLAIWRKRPPPRH